MLGEVITLCDLEGSLIYGHDQQRRKYIHKKNGVVQYVKYYFGNYEKKIDYISGITKEVTYVAGAAIVKETNKLET